MPMDKEINTVTIPVSEYKSLILAAEKASQKEHDLKSKLELQIDKRYSDLYKQKIEILQRNAIQASTDANMYRMRYEELKAELGKIRRPKKHWWNL